MNCQAPDVLRMDNAVKFSYENLNGDKRNDGDRNMPSEYKERKSFHNI